MKIKKYWCNISISLTTGGTAGNFVFNSGNGLARGVDYVLLDKETEISGTATFQADVLPCWERTPSRSPIISNSSPMPTNYLKMLNHVRKKN